MHQKPATVTATSRRSYEESIPDRKIDYRPIMTCSSYGRIDPYWLQISLCSAMSRTGINTTILNVVFRSLHWHSADGILDIESRSGLRGRQEPPFADLRVIRVSESRRNAPERTTALLP